MSEIIRVGDVVNAYGIAWEVLDVSYDAKDGTGILCIAKEPIREMAFSKDNYNNYETSDIREYLSDLTEEKEKAGAEFLTVDLNLTTDDGMKWNSMLDRHIDKLEVKGFFLLTDQMYRDYHFNNETKEKIISDKQTPWWTATAYSFSSGYSHLARTVRVDGSLSYNSACSRDRGVVPACVFYSLPLNGDDEERKKEIEDLKVRAKELKDEVDKVLERINALSQ